MARMGPRMGPNEGPNEGPYPKKLSPPVGFAWAPSFDVSEVAPREFSLSLNTETLKVATSTIRYVDLSAGSDANTGLVKSAPKQSIWSATLAASAAQTVYVKGSSDPDSPTVYPFANSWRLPLSFSMNIIVVSDFDTLAPGYAVSSVQSSPTDINGHSSLAVDMYVERLDFAYGHARAFFLQNVGTATFVDCDAYQGTQEGLSLTTSAAATVHTLYLVRCRAYDNQNGDGFPYTATGAGSTIRVLEWDCEGFDNVGASSQGSSGHFTAGNAEVSIIRVGGRYYGNGAQEAADVGCQSWNLGCTFDGQDAAGIGYTMSGTGTAWLHGCVLTGNATDITTDDAGGTVNVYDTSYRTTSGAGTVQAYVP